MTEPRVERVVTISYLTLLRVVGIFVILVFLWTIREIVALIFVALVLAAVMMPFVNVLRRYRIPASLSALLFYLLLFGVLGSAVALALPQLFIQASKIGVTIGHAWGVFWDGTAGVRQFAEQYGLRDNISAGIASLETSFAVGVGNFVLSLKGLVGGLAAIIVVLALAFYMVVEEREAIKWIKIALPDHQDFVANLLVEIQRKFGRWLIGQLVLSAIIGFCYYVGLRILGVEGAFVLSLAAACAEFIPYAGPLIGGSFIVLIALAQSPVLALFSVILMIVIHQLESHILIPKVMQRAVGLNPVVSIIALLVCAKLFGIVGAILAIPATAAIWVSYIEYRRYRSELSRTDTDTPSNPPAPESFLPHS